MSESSPSSGWGREDEEEDWSSADQSEDDYEYDVAMGSSNTIYIDSDPDVEADVLAPEAEPEVDVEPEKCDNPNCPFIKSRLPDCILRREHPDGSTQILTEVFCCWKCKDFAESDCDQSSRPGKHHGAECTKITYDFKPHEYDAKVKFEGMVYRTHRTIDVVSFGQDVLLPLEDERMGMMQCMTPLHHGSFETDVSEIQHLLVRDYPDSHVLVALNFWERCIERLMALDKQRLQHLLTVSVPMAESQREEWWEQTSVFQQALTQTRPQSMHCTAMILLEDNKSVVVELDAKYSKERIQRIQKPEELERRFLRGKTGRSEFMSEAALIDRQRRLGREQALIQRRS